MKRFSHNFAPFSILPSFKTAILSFANFALLRVSAQPQNMHHCLQLENKQDRVVFGCDRETFALLFTKVILFILTLYGSFLLYLASLTAFLINRQKRRPWLLRTSVNTNEEGIKL